MKIKLHVPVVDFVTGKPAFEIGIEVGPDGAIKQVGNTLMADAVIANALTEADQNGLTVVQKMERWALGMKVMTGKEAGVELTDAEILTIDTVLGKAANAKVYGFIHDFLGVKNG